MSLKFHPGLLAALLLGIALCEPPARADEEAGAPSAAAPAAAYADEWDALKARLGATNEEWSVIYPQLWQIRMLRDDIHAPEGTPGAGRRGILGGALDSPMGGTSLNAPTMPGRSGAGASGRDRPFEAKNAPGAPTANVGVLRGLLGRIFVNAIMPDQNHPVQTALTELRTLLDSYDASEDQIRDKLAVVRAVRHKALRDLAAAQKKLVPYLTVEQTAVLVSLGYLD